MGSRCFAVILLAVAPRRKFRMTDVAPPLQELQGFVADPLRHFGVVGGQPGFGRLPEIFQHVHDVQNDDHLHSK